MDAVVDKSTLSGCLEISRSTTKASHSSRFGSSIPYKFWHAHILVHSLNAGVNRVQKQSFERHGAFTPKRGHTQHPSAPQLKIMRLKFWHGSLSMLMGDAQFRCGRLASLCSSVVQATPPNKQTPHKKCEEVSSSNSNGILLTKCPSDLFSGGQRRTSTYRRSIVY